MSDHSAMHHPPITGTSGKCPALTPGGTTATDNPEARNLLQQAFASTYRWPKGFGGFRADLICTQAGLSSKGTVRVVSARDVEVKCDDEGLKGWASGQISMMAVHRGPRTFEESDGRHILTLESDDGHPMGRAIRIHGDGMNSFYRIAEGRITQTADLFNMMVMLVPLSLLYEVGILGARFFGRPSLSSVEA